MILLTDEWHKSNMARAVPGAYWDTATKHYVIDKPTPRSAAVVLKLFPDVGQRHPELAGLRDELLADVRPFDNATPFDTRIHAPRVRAILDKKGWALFNYQAIDLGYAHAVIKEHGGAYIGWQMGMGKTLAACCLLDELNATSTLIVAPNTAKEAVWAAALREFTPWVEVIVLPNAKVKRERVIASLKGRTKPFALVAHYESLALIAGKNKQGKLGEGWAKLGITWDFVAADEAHRLSNPKALMVRALKKVPSKARVALSGTPLRNSLEELFSQLQWLFPDTYKSKWRDWCDRFLDYVEGGFGRILVGVKPHMVDAMRAELGVFSVYRRKADELDLPPLIEREIRIDLSAAQRKVYNELVATCIAELEDGTKIKADIGVAMLGKLRQIATGLDLFGNVTDSTKMDLAADMVLDAPDEAFIIFGWHKAGVYAMAERLAKAGVQAECITGDVPHTKRAEIIADFQSGTGRVICGSIASLGESVNMQRASQVIFLETTWTPADNAQARDRVYRTGQSRKVTSTTIVARDTVDEFHVLPALASKQEMMRVLLGSAL